MSPHQTTHTYSFSFTAASLRLDLVGLIAELFFQHASWEKTRDAVLAKNLLQYRSAGSTIRLERELRQRLQTLTPEQLRLLQNSTSASRVLLAWLAAVNHSGFLFDFAAEVLRAKLSQHDDVLRLSDYERFVTEKMVLHPQLGALTQSSSTKIRTVLFRMLREAGILTDGDGLGRIQRPVLPPEVTDAICEADPNRLAAFLVPDAEIKANVYSEA